MAKTYADKLRDPRWQKKRLEILERDGFRCRRCHDESQTLHVHHGVYLKGLAPWEYDNALLWTLCEPCHGLAERTRERIYHLIGQLPPEAVSEVLTACETLVTMYPPTRPEPKAEKREPVSLEEAVERISSIRERMIQQGGL